jgi:hypothetical protein
MRIFEFIAMAVVVAISAISIGLSFICEPIFRGGAPEPVPAIDEKMQSAIKNNRHIGQSVQYSNKVSQSDFESLRRVLPEDAPREPYRRRKNDFKTVIHWGQRKLLMSEIEFLTIHAKPGDTVVYAGAAPGNHTYFLSLLFPFIKLWVLVDPSDFYCISTTRISVRQEFFTDEVAKEFTEIGKAGQLLFISDIRTACWQVMNEKEVEEAVESDMDAQQRWHLLMQARVSMLKFRLPWKQGLKEYLNGDVYLPVWGPSTTTETRLITTPACKSKQIMKHWDNQKYEEQLFYFNTKTRTTLFDHPIKVAGLDQCYDCAAEVLIWRNYMKKYHGIWGHAAAKMKHIFRARRGSSKSNGADDAGDDDGSDAEGSDAEDDEDIPTKLKRPRRKEASAQEVVLMRLVDSWEEDKGIWTTESLEDAIKLNVLVTEAIEMTSPMCSSGRTLLSKLPPMKMRNWFTPRRFEGNRIVKFPTATQPKNHSAQRSLSGDSV